MSTRYVWGRYTRNWAWENTGSTSTGFNGVVATAQKNYYCMFWNNYTIDNAGRMVPTDMETVRISNGGTVSPSSGSAKYFAVDDSTRSNFIEDVYSPEDPSGLAVSREFNEGTGRNRFRWPISYEVVRTAVKGSYLSDVSGPSQGPYPSCAPAVSGPG